jgi:hypothetical protein
MTARALKTPLIMLMPSHIKGLKQVVKMLKAHNLVAT